MVRSRHEAAPEQPLDAARRLTLEQVQRATRTSVVERFVRELCDGTPWEVVKVRRRSRRLAPPVDYWATYRITLERARKGAAEPDRRQLRLVARACFDPDDWERLRTQLLADRGDAPCDPLDGTGYPVLFDSTQHAFWFFPYDPALPTLARATDPKVLRPLLAPRYSQKTKPARVDVDVVRYVPESGAVLRITVGARPGVPEQLLYGKVYRAQGGAALHATMRVLADLADARPELLAVARPVRYEEDLALHLETPAAGVPVPSDRTSASFQDAAVAAARALVAFHESGLDNDMVLELEPEVARLEDVADQLTFVHAPAGLLMRDLLRQLHRAVDRLPAEDRTLTHGDMKYDQFLQDGEVFTLVDFEEVGVAELSWDLGKWCAHAVPSQPESWEASDGAERARAAFLQTYRELRPDVALPRFPLYEAVHLANRAMVLMWGQVEGWEQAAESLLALAAERLLLPAP